MSSQNPSNILKFKWKIQNFYEVTSIEKCALIVSEEFHFNGYKNLLFQLEFCPLNLDTRKHSSVYIHSKPVDNYVEQELECHFWIENADGNYIERSKYKFFSFKFANKLKFFRLQMVIKFKTIICWS